MAPVRTLRVGSAVARPGKWTTGVLTLGHYPDGPITAPVNILAGRRPGPTLWVQCSIHGTEIGGAIGVLRFFRQIDPAAMRGAIVAVMAANPTAFRGFARNTPLDGANLNRLFPGDRRGPHSHQSASVLMETAFGIADAMMDLHSGGNEAIVPFYAIYRDEDSEAARAAARLARAAGTRDLWASRDVWLEGAMFASFTRQGKPGLIIECGGGGPVPEADVESFVRAVGGVARALGILPGRPPRQRRYRVMGEGLIVYNTRGGYFVPAARVGAVVPKGRVIGRIMDPHGRTVEEVRAPNGPAYLGALARAYLPVYSGAMVAECLEVVQGR
jgi:predicted deacylase